MWIFTQTLRSPTTQKFTSMGYFCLEIEGSNEN